jgi:hypothetical protein
MKKGISILTVFLVIASLLTGSVSACIPFPGMDILTVTQEGQPLAGAQINLYRLNPYGGEDTLLGTYKTGSNGQVTAGHLTTGQYYWEDGSAVFRKDFRITGAGTVRTAIDLPASVSKVVTFGGREVTVEADLSGGYLGEINSYGTLYLYDEISPKLQICNGYLMDGAEYAERVEDCKIYGDGYVEDNGAFISWTEGEYGNYTVLFKAAKDVYCMLVVDYGADLEDVIGRVSVTVEGAEEDFAIGMANPWSDAETAEEAADGAGVGYFLVPENGTEAVGGRIDWFGFRYMDRLAEADGAVGAAELTVRKGLKQDSEDVSGDYTEYAYTWTQEADGWEVTCYGNEEGRMMKAVWLSDNFSYSVTVRGQGDLYTVYGLGADDVVALVTAIQ